MLRNCVAALLACLLASGCASYKAVGTFDDYNEPFIGDVNANLMTGGGTFVIEGQTSKLRCEGTAFPPTNPGLSCTGQHGEGRVSCSDGRRLRIEWYATSCTTGRGEGRDQRGATFQFAFGYDETSAKAELQKMAKLVENAPRLPNPKEASKEKGYSSGTGFFVTDDGVFVTNNHVIKGSSTISVVNPVDHKEYPAQLLKTDPINDIAVLKADLKTIPIPVAERFNGVRGEEVLTLGFPITSFEGREQKATFGRINALSGMQDDIRYAQVDVPIQPGNSGGPLLNRRGEVVGVVTATLATVVTAVKVGTIPQNINYAMKVDYMLPVLRVAAVDSRLTHLDAGMAVMDMVKVVNLREQSVVQVIAR